MEKLVELGHSKHISLRIATNGMQADDDWLALFEQFADTGLNLSVDGFSTVTEYIRYPSRWSVIDSNIRRMRSVPNLFLATNMTVQAYNVLNVTDYFDYCQDMDMIFGFHLLQGPARLSVSAMPDSVRRLAVQRLRDYAASHPQQAGQKNNPQMLLPLASAIEMQTYNPANAANFMLFTRQMDKSRLQSIEASLPELWAMLQEAELAQAV